MKKSFTRDELEFMRDGSLFDQKEEITKRIQGILEDFRDTLKGQVRPEEFHAPGDTDFIQGQVVRGERFHQRPYVYLDYPKFFSRQAMFTFRSFFWWGWDFVFAYLLSGPYLPQYKQNLIHHLDQMSAERYYLSVAETPWEWRRSCPTTIPLEGQRPRDLEGLLSKMDYLKIQYFVGLDDPVWVQGDLVAKGVRVFNGLKVIVSRKAV